MCTPQTALSALSSMPAFDKFDKSNKIHLYLWCFDGILSGLELFMHLWGILGYEQRLNNFFKLIFLWIIQRLVLNILQIKFNKIIFPIQQLQLNSKYIKKFVG